MSHFPGPPPRAEGEGGTWPSQMLGPNTRQRAVMKLLKIVSRQIVLGTVVTVVVIATGHLVSYFLG